MTRWRGPTIQGRLTWARLAYAPYLGIDVPLRATIEGSPAAFSLLETHTAHLCASQNHTVLISVVSTTFYSAASLVRGSHSQPPSTQIASKRVEARY